MQMQPMDKYEEVTTDADFVPDESETGQQTHAKIGDYSFSKVVPLSPSHLRALRWLQQQGGRAEIRKHGVVSAKDKEEVYSEARVMAQLVGYQLVEYQLNSFTRIRLTPKGKAY